ncbi:MAG: EVE domain-containing protein [Bdellovibrionota bacterium]
MRYWLMKSETDVFGIEAFKKAKKTDWDGVRNYQARNYMRDDMRVGDLVFFYHSNAEPTGIAGIARVSRASHPDETQFDKKSDYYDAKATREKPIWFLVEIEFVEAFKEVISLARLKNEKALAKMVLLQKGSRLSVQPVAEAEWKFIEKLKS